MAEYPRIDTRTYYELASQTETLAKLATSTAAPELEELLGRVLDETIETAEAVYRAGTLLGEVEAQAIVDALEGSRRVQVRPWRPDATVADPAWTLVRVFSRMVGQLTSRLNRVPEKHRLAFLNLVGLTRRPPRAARAALTFESTDAAEKTFTSEGLPLTVLVPAGTQVSASAQEGLAEATFETSSDLTLTFAKLLTAFSRVPAEDLYADRSDNVLSGNGFQGFGGELPMDHSIFMRCDSLWGLPGRQWLGLTLQGVTADVQQLMALPLCLYWGDGTRWWPLFQSASWKAWDGSNWVSWQGFPGITSGMQIRLASDGGNTGLTSSQVKVTAGFAYDASGRQLGILDTVLDLATFTDPVALLLIRWKASTSTSTSSETAVISESMRLSNPDLYPETEWLQLARLVVTRSTTVTVSRGLTSTTSTPSTGVTAWQFQVPVPPSVLPFRLPGQDETSSPACWLKLQLTGQLSQTTEDPPGLPQSLTLKGRVQTSRSGLTPDQALFNTQFLDLTKDFRPFGDRPAFNDTFYLRHDEAFSRPGVTVVMSLAISDYLTTNSFKDLVPVLAWEAWNGSQWTELGRSSASSTNTTNTSSSLVDGSKAFTVNNATITLTLPSTTGPVTVLSQTGYWIRVRLIQGDYGQEMTARPSADGSSLVWVAKTLQPPSLKSWKTQYTLTAEAGLDGCIRQENQTQTDVGALSLTPGFEPFVRGSESLPTLYLGFDRAFEPRPVTLYVEVQSPLPQDASPTEVEATPPPPPQVSWEYFARQSNGPGAWTRLLVEDNTRNFSGSGTIRFIGPADAQAREELGQARHWIRATWTAAAGQRQPRIGYVLPNTVEAHHLVTVTDELLGSSDGTPDQSFTISQTPVLAGEWLEVREPEPPTEGELIPLERALGHSPVREVQESPGSPPQLWVRWQPMTDFYSSGPTDRHYVLDHFTGKVTFGNGRNGRIPPPFQGSHSSASTSANTDTQLDDRDTQTQGSLRLHLYQHGGGASGNRAARNVSQLKSSIIGVKAVKNLLPTSGGADAEANASLESRGARILRHGGRAVTVQDFEDLALEASSVVARARAIPPSFDASEQNDAPQTDDVLGEGTVLVVIVPQSTEKRPVPGEELIGAVEAYLKARATPSAGLKVSGPAWAEVKVSVSLSPANVSEGERILGKAQAVIDDFLHPLTGGRDGTGWEFGRRPHPSDLYPLLAAIEGVDHVDSLNITCDDMPSDETTLSRSELRALSWHLIFSGTHSIGLVSAGEENPT